MPKLDEDVIAKDHAAIEERQRLKFFKIHKQLLDEAGPLTGRAP